MMVVASAVAMGWLSVVAMGSPVLHKVGGSKGWINHDVNYTEWAAQEHVYVGDWLSKCIYIIYFFCFLNLIPCSSKLYSRFHFITLIL